MELIVGKMPVGKLLKVYTKAQMFAKPHIPLADIENIDIYFTSKPAGGFGVRPTPILSCLISNWKIIHLWHLIISLQQIKMNLLKQSIIWRIMILLLRQENLGWIEEIIKEHHISYVAHKVIYILSQWKIRYGLKY